MSNDAPKPKRYIVRDAQTGQVIGHAELRPVPVRDIRIDSEYQRDVSRPWINAHLPFDARRAGAIVVSSRAGGPYCIDGGHRLELARESGVTHVNAFVIDDLTKPDEAKLFTQYQRERRNLTSHALYRADLVAQDEATMAMRRIVANAGFVLSNKSGDNHITAIDAIRYIHRRGGDDLLARTLNYVAKVWLGIEKSLSGQVLKGIALFLESAGEDPAFSTATFESVMRSIAPMKLLLLSQTIAAKRSAVTGSSANVAEALHQAYVKAQPKGTTPLGPLTISGRKRPRAFNQ